MKHTVFTVECSCGSHVAFLSEKGRQMFAALLVELHPGCKQTLTQRECDCEMEQLTTDVCVELKGA